MVAKPVQPFLSQEVAMLSVSTKNKDLWLVPNQEVRDSRTSRSSTQTRKFETIVLPTVTKMHLHCVCAYFGTGQKSLFLVLTERIATSGDARCWIQQCWTMLHQHVGSVWSALYDIFTRKWATCLFKHIFCCFIIYPLMLFHSPLECLFYLVNHRLGLEFR